MTTLIQATIEDAVMLKQVAAQSLIESHGHSAPAKDIDAYVAAKFSLAALEEELKDTKNIFHIIFHNQVPAGYSKIIFNVTYHQLTPVNTTKMERLYLLKDFYDLKLGVALFDHAIAVSKKAGQTGVWLQVWTANDRAINFYKKNGFKIIAEDGFKVSETHTNPNHIMYLEY